MRHEAGDIPRFIADSSNIPQRSVWIADFRRLALAVYVLPQDLIFRFKPIQRFTVRKITAFPVRDGHAQQFAVRNLVGEWRVGGKRLQKNVLAAELERAIADQRSGEKSRLAEDLEAVANAEHEPAICRKSLHLLHDGAEPGDGAGAQIISIAEAARNDDTIHRTQ